jgi:hypothetical protein
MDDIKAIHDAWDQEGSIRRLGLLPFADKAIQKALVPPGGDWQCVAEDGAITRSVMWNHKEVALINPGGWMLDRLEGDIAMGIRATPVMDRALRVIFVLARDPANLDLIGKIARAAIDYVEQPAPAIVEPEGETDEEEPAF